MTAASVVMLAVGVAMDATAVAAARGLAAERVRARDVALVGLLFGGSQGAMPLLGWIIGARLGPHVAAWDHWIAFGLLGAIGAKMLWDARGGAEHEPIREPFAPGVLVVLAIATSIDAFAIGITLPMVGASMVATLLAIGGITAALSMLGVVAGRRFGAALGPRLGAIGGLVLIGFGTKILIEHLSA